MLMPTIGYLTCYCYCCEMQMTHADQAVAVAVMVVEYCSPYEVLY